MWDAIIVGAGPAGSVAATILAREGARVLLVDRAWFPRDKLCGDSLNPGTLEALRRLYPARWHGEGTMAIEGMLVTGPSGARVEGWYPAGMRGATMLRRELDRWLLEQAMRAGAQFEEGVVVREAVADGGDRVTGIRLAHGRRAILRASITIAADGRRSALASRLGLAAPASRRGRWAVGAYFEGVAALSALGEMHIRQGQYVGVAPIPGGLANACLVAPASAIREAGGPKRALERAIGEDHELCQRFAGARMVTRPAVLGPLAMDVRAAGVRGLLLAGDAAGFIDPMTGDGLRFAIEGARLAAAVAVEHLARGLPDEHLELARRRRAAFAWKWRFNRSLRSLVDRPAGIGLAARCAEVLPAVVRSLVAIAGDCRSASTERRSIHDP
jgi:flavin-dependent dehydrogenase